MTTTTSGFDAATSSHVDCADGSPAQPGDVLATRHLDELRRPVPGDEHRVQPLERGHARPRLAADGETDDVRPPRRARDEIERRVLRAGRLRDRADVAERLAVGLRIQRDHARRLGQRDRQRLDLVVRHGADVAQRLRDDEVGLELADELLVELVDRLAGAGALTDGRVDLGGRQALGQDVARHRQDVARGLGVVALVGDAHDVVAEPQREQQLGSVWDEGDDPHDREGMARVMSVLSDEIIDERLAGTDWRREGDTIVRDVELDGFTAAMALANEVADASRTRPTTTRTSSSTTTSTCG